MQSFARSGTSTVDLAALGGELQWRGGDEEAWQCLDAPHFEAAHS